MGQSTTDSLMARMWSGYSAVTPSAARVHALLEARGETVANDHIALRTVDRPGVALDDVAAPFLGLGWRPTGDYVFEVKRLRARSYSHPEPGTPRVFISELRTGLFEADGPVHRLADAFAGAVDVAAFAADGVSPFVTTHGEWTALAAVSEYAAWLGAWGLRANHFTVSVNALRGFDDVAGLNAWLVAEGFALNTSGGAIKGTPADRLEQSSTLADRIPQTFACGTRAEVPSCYYEFALRHPDPATGQLFDGFVTQSADRIFESTDIGAGT
jgi:hypothetical protein